MDDIYDKLIEISEPVQIKQERSKVSVHEKGVKYQANVVPKRNSAVFQVDGNIIKQGQKCDKLLLVEDINSQLMNHGFFIELKGSDINHALDQLIATLQNPIFIKAPFLSKHARLVGCSYPSSKGNPKVEKCRNELKDKFKCDLKTFHNGQIDNIDSLNKEY